MSEQTTENLVQSVTTYAQDLEGHLEDLVARLEGNDEGRAMFARDRVQEAIEDLEKIDVGEGSD